MARDLDRERLAAIVIVLLVAGALAVITAGPVAAQSTSTTANASAAGAEQGGTSVVAQVDGDVRVLDYSYAESSETFTVEIENTGVVATSVTITEAISAEQSGAGTFGIEVVSVDDGETVAVEVAVADDGGTAGVMITTDESIEQGTGTFLQVDTGGASLFDGPAGWGEVRAGVLTTLLVCLGVVVLAGWHVVASRHETVQEVDVDG